jgi:hypothetical protein
MPSKTFRAGVERLEVREVQSAMPFIPAAAAVSLSLLGSGTGVVASHLAIPNGSYMTISRLTGTAVGLGAFTGFVVADFAVDQLHVDSGSAVFTGPGGSQVFASVTGLFQLPVRGATHTTGDLNLTIVGGTGTLVGATGQAHMHISQNVSNGNLKFALEGRIS